MGFATRASGFRQAGGGGSSQPIQPVGAPASLFMQNATSATFGSMTAIAGNLLYMTVSTYADVSGAAATITSVTDTNSAAWTGIDSKAGPTTAMLTTTVQGIPSVTGATTITVHFSNGTNMLAYGTCQQFGHSTGSTWAVVASQFNLKNGTGGTSVTYGSLVPSGAGQLWVAGAGVETSTTAPAGYTKVNPGGGSTLTYNANVSAAVAPTIPLSPISGFGNYWAAIAVIYGIS